MAGFEQISQPTRSPFGRFRALTSALLTGVLALASCHKKIETASPAAQLDFTSEAAFEKEGLPVFDSQLREILRQAGFKYITFVEADLEGVCYRVEYGGDSYLLRLIKQSQENSFTGSILRYGGGEYGDWNALENFFNSSLEEISNRLPERLRLNKREKSLLDAFDKELSSPELEKHEAAGVMSRLGRLGLVAFEVDTTLEDSVDYKISYKTSPEKYLFFGARIKAEEDGQFSATAYSETLEEWGSCNSSKPEELAKCLRKMAEEHRGE